jgi:type III secretion protein V
VHLALMSIEPAPGGPMLGRPESVWVTAEHAPALVRAGVAHLDAAEALAASVSSVLARYAAQFVGIQETKALLTRMERDYGELVRETQRAVPLQKIADVLRRLLEEGVSVCNLRLVFEALVEWGPKEPEIVLLVEYVRGVLKRQICHRYADAQRTLAAWLVERDVEEMVRKAVRQTTVGAFLALPEDVTERLVQTLRAELEAGPPDRPAPVVLTALDVRRFVRGLLVRNGLDLPVLSYQELAPEFTVQPLGALGLPAAARIDRAVADEAAE